MQRLRPVHRPYRVQRLKVMSRVQELEYTALTLLWVAANCYFWIWWLTTHVGNAILFGSLSVALFYTVTLLPSFFTFYLGRMRRPRPVTVQRAVRAGVVKRVAMITLHVPGSENTEVVRRQLVALTRVTYPHDSWILVDGAHSPEIAALAGSLGVRYFSRHDVQTWGEDQVARWNQPVPPFQTKTKAGNVNTWIDAVGELYDHFTQLDIDHVPQPAYLDRVLGFFLDRKVAWVQAPSIYGNTHLWPARGAAEQEFVLQGPLQMGFFGFCRTPFIIGSHTTYSMAAIRRIGGFQPTRAEDHLDTVFLAAAGYQGVYWPEPIAWGDGPETFETYVAQQFAWAYSMIQVLFQYTPKRLRYYTGRQAVQFLFVQTWYTLWSTSTLLLFATPSVALITDTTIAAVPYWQFVLHMTPVFVMATAIWWWSRPWQQPTHIGLSWRGIILQVARWPIVVSALIQVILRVKKPYMITTKGLHRGENRPFALKAHAPYFALIVLSIAACWFYIEIFSRGASQGYLLFALQGAVIVTLVYVVVLFKNITALRAAGVSIVQTLALRATPLLILCTIALVLVVTSVASAGRISEAIFWSTPFYNATPALPATPPALPATPPVLPATPPVPLLVAPAAPQPSSTLLVNPATVHFSPRTISGAGVAQAIHVVNLEARPITMRAIVVTGADADEFLETDTCAGKTIGVYGGCTISVTFAPIWSPATPSRARLVIEDNAATQPHGVALSAPAMPVK